MITRTISIAACLSLVLALAGSAGAVGIPLTDPDYAGPVLMHVTNFAMGTVYDGTVDDGTGTFVPVYNGTNWFNPGTSMYDLPASPQYAAGTLGVLAPANGAKTGESGWGVFTIDTIYKATLIGPNNIAMPDTLNPLYSAGVTSTTVLAGAYFNRTDISVRFDTTDLLTQTFEFKGDTFEVFTQSTAPNFLQGSSGRLPGMDKYASIGYDSLGALLPGAELVLSGVSEPGYFGTNPATEGTATFTVIGTTGQGQADLFYTLTGGSELATWNSDIFIPTKMGAFNNADIRLHVTDSAVFQSGNFDWLTSSSDPLTAARMIPEPLTMLGLLLSAGSVAGYIRRRRTA